IVSWLTRPEGPYPPRRTLPPSRSAHYLSSIYFNGFADDTIDEEVVIEGGGAATVCYRRLVSFVRGKKTTCDGFVHADSPAQLISKKIAAFKSPQPGDNIKGYGECLDALFSGMGAPPSIETIQPESFGFKFKPSDATPKKDIWWHIETAQSMPEG